MDFAKFRSRLNKRWDEVGSELSLLGARRGFSLVRDDVYAVNVPEELKGLTTLDAISPTEISFEAFFPIHEPGFLPRENVDRNEAFVWAKWLAYCANHDQDPGTFEPAMYPHPLARFYEPSDDDSDED